MNLNELQARVYQTALSKGWHDGRPNGIPYRETRALIVSELSEALEAFREGEMRLRFAFRGRFQQRRNKQVAELPRIEDLSHAEHLKIAAAGHKPEGFGIELADTAIRVLHRTGAAKRTWDEYDHRYIAKAGEYSGGHGPRGVPADVRTVPEQIDWLIETAIMIDIGAIFLARLNTVACANNVDLWASVELKAKYNETRPYKHGNKRA